MRRGGGLGMASVDDLIESLGMDGTTPEASPMVTPVKAHAGFTPRRGVPAATAGAASSSAALAGASPGGNSRGDWDWDESPRLAYGAAYGVTPGKLSTSTSGRPVGGSGGTWGATDGLGAALALTSPGRGLGLGAQRKCLAPHLCGTAFPVGLTSSSASPHSCDRLRCTKCDFRVTLIPGSAWKQGVDYLFLRNNAPDVARLRPMLNGDPASTAFCCQCTSMTRKVPLRIDPFATGWSCTGH